MNYEQARQVDPKSDRQDAGKWRWTNMRDGKAWPTGHCSPFEVCPECQGETAIYGRRADEPCGTCNKTGVVEKSDPCPGHDTPEEAAKHNWEYQLDHAIYDFKIRDPQRCRFPKCGRFSTNTAQVDTYTIYVLCGRHLNREALAEIHSVSSGSIHS
jgi:hypothetical protein